MNMSRIPAAAMLLACIFLSAQVEATPPVQRRVRQLHIGNRSVIQSLLAAGANAKVPMGLVLADNELCEKKVELNIEDDAMEGVLDAITKQVPSYAWTRENGVVLISPKALPENARKLLELVVPTYTISESTLAAQRLSLWMDVRAVLKPDEGTAIDMLESPGAPKRGSISLQNATVKQILSLMISAAPVGAWVVFPLPQNFRSAADRQFAAVFSYADKIGLPDISCSSRAEPK